MWDFNPLYVWLGSIASQAIRPRGRPISAVPAKAGGVSASSPTSPPRSPFGEPTPFLVFRLVNPREAGRGRSIINVHKKRVFPEQ